MGHGKGKKHSGRGSRKGHRRDPGNRRSAGRRSYTSNDEENLDNFASGNELSNNFISLQQNRKNSPTFKLNKKLKVSKLQKINELVDLNRGNFNSMEEMSLNSIMYQQSNKRRKNKNSMYNEVSYTSRNREELLNKSFRKLTIEFVRAKEVYDPSKLLLERLSQNNISNSTKLDELSAEKLINEDKFVEIRDENESDEIESEKYVDIELGIGEIGEEDNRENNDMDDGSDKVDKIKSHLENKKVCGEIEIEKERGEEKKFEDDDDNNNNISENSENKIGLRVIRNSVEQKNEIGNELLKKPQMSFQNVTRKIKKSKIRFIDDNNDESFEHSFDESVIDSDEDSENTYHTDNKIRINEYSGDDDISEILEVDDDEYRNSEILPNFQMGNLLTTMKETANGDTFIELNRGFRSKKNMKKKTERSIYVVSDHDDNLKVQDVINHVNKKMYGINGYDDRSEVDDKSEHEEPEFGFLEEDYVSFDITGITIDNIRVGSDINNQQYNVKAPVLFGFDDFQWIDRNDFIHFLTENGFPEHRFDAFIKSVTSHIFNPKEIMKNEIFDEDEIYISDSSIEEEENPIAKSNKFSSMSTKVNSRISLSPSESSDLDEDLMEGIEDLLNMHQKSSKTYFDPMETDTKSIKIKGRKKNPELEFNTEISPEFQKYLTDKYINKKEKRKEQKEEREFARKNNAYMLTKYPYLLEMDEIMHEFKEFWKDNVRESLRFPPMDFHVNMVLKMIAEAYGYSSRKVGKGKKQYLEVRKPKKNKNKEPHWDRLKKISSKRNVCFRMDVELSREEKRELKRIKGGNYAVEKMKNRGRGNFSYKEGEIVGGDAKEIDASSIGRKLLEKMGWQTGDALGPQHNKGIIEPIKAVVKTSKRGIQ